MSQEYSCINLLQVTEAEKKEGVEQLKAAANIYAAKKAFEKSVAALKAVWQTDIGGLDRRTMEEGNVDFVLCKQVVVEHPVAAPVAETKKKKGAEKKAAKKKAVEDDEFLEQAEILEHATFLEQIAKGDRISAALRLEKAEAEEAGNQYPFQGRTFEPSHTFQPQMSRPSWTYSG